MTGFKFKIAHKRAGNEKWSASETAQKKKLISFLKEMISHLEKTEEHKIILPEEPKKKATKVKTKLLTAEA